MEWVEGAGVFDTMIGWWIIDKTILLTLTLLARHVPHPPLGLPITSEEPHVDWDGRITRDA